jgi:hypothetical protein
MLAASTFRGGGRGRHDARHGSVRPPCHVDRGARHSIHALRAVVVADWPRGPERDLRSRLAVRMDPASSVARAVSLADHLDARRRRSGGRCLAEAAASAGCAAHQSRRDTTKGRRSSFRHGGGSRGGRVARLERWFACAVVGVRARSRWHRIVVKRRRCHSPNAKGNFCRLRDHRRNRTAERCSHSAVPMEPECSGGARSYHPQRAPP